MGNEAKFFGASEKQQQQQQRASRLSQQLQLQQVALSPHSPLQSNATNVTSSSNNNYYSYPENPNKITHSFWLQQHSWLHSSDRPREEASGSAEKDKEKQQAGRWSSSRHQLFARLSSFVRGRSNTTTPVPSSPARSSMSGDPRASAKRKSPSKGSSQPPAISPRNFTLNPLSSSTSTLPNSSRQPQLLLTVDAATGEPAADENRTSNRRSRSSCCATDESASQATKQPTSPYKQLARLLRRRSRSNTPEAKRSRLVQFAAATASKGNNQAPTTTTTGGRLSNLFVSPLFRRRECGSSCCSSSAASGGSGDDDDNNNNEDLEQLELNDNLVGRASRRKRKKQRSGEHLKSVVAARNQQQSASQLAEERRSLVPAATSTERQTGSRAQVAVDEDDGEQVKQLQGETTVHETNLPATIDNNNNKNENDECNEAERSLLPLIQPLASSRSASSFGSLCLSITGQHAADSVQPSASCQVSCSPVENLRVVVALSEPDNENNNNSSSGDDNKKPVAELFNQSASQRPVSQPVECQQQRQKVGQAPSSGVGVLRNGFKKLVKRQQSVDSYRMARDLKNKLKRQSGAGGGGVGGNNTDGVGATKHQSNEAIKTKSVGDEAAISTHSGRGKLRIFIDPDAEVGGENEIEIEPEGERSPPINKQRLGPQPPNTLSLMPVVSGQQPFIVGSFSGSITPTYPTHHLPSPKYHHPAPPAVKKYSNASSTLSSNADSSLHLSGARTIGQQQQQPVASDSELLQQQQQRGHSPMMNLSAHMEGNDDTPSTCSATPDNRSPLPATTTAIAPGGVQQLAAEEAARRAQLAEHIYDNKCGLGEDMKFLASLPELCDITFLVGETREPVCAVKSVLAARSRVFHKILFGNRVRRVANYHQQSQQQRDSSATTDHWTAPTAAGLDQSQVSIDRAEQQRRDSSPRTAKKSVLSLAKSSSPSVGRPTSPSGANNNQQQQQQQWSVVADASGYNPQTPSPQMGAGGGDERGRFSVTSGGRDSSSGLANSQNSILGAGVGGGSQGGSQQPLIIGPGQTATPAPPSSTNPKRGGKGKLKSSIKDGSHHSGGGGTGSRLSRMFTKRASDPSIKHQNSVSSANQANQSSYLDKMSSSQMSTTMIIEEFEPDVFRQLIEYIHTGCVLLQARTLLGLLNAADYYGLEQLRKACLRFVTYCITVDTVCSLLSTAERYIQYKCTKSIVQKVLEFVDTHADEIFKLNAFGLLPEHVVRLILARDGLQADEQVKYNGVYTWCEHYCRSYELTNIADVMRNFLDLIQFHKIPTSVLLGEIYPTHIVPDNIFLSALAYQADPQNFEPQPMQARRMTLPNPTFHKNYADGDGDDDDNEDEDDEQAKSRPSTTLNADDLHAGGGSKSGSQVRLQLVPTTNGDDTNDNESPTKRRSSPTIVATGGAAATERYGSQQQLAKSPGAATSHRPLRSRKSTGGQPEAAAAVAMLQQDGAGGKQTFLSNRAAKLRKGSIAQASINGMVRLSRKLSIKKRFSNQPSQNSAPPGEHSPAGFRRRLGSMVSNTSGEHARATRHKLRISKQQSAVGAGPQSDSGARDPMQLGQQILDAYLEEQRQRELEEEQRRQRERREKQMATEAKRRANQPAGQANQSASGGQQPVAAAAAAPEAGEGSTVAESGGASPSTTTSANRRHKPIVKSLSTRKSFKDFKHISRRIFMRHSSSKALHNIPQQQQQQQQQQQPPDSPTMSISSNQQQSSSQAQQTK